MTVYQSLKRVAAYLHIIPRLGIVPVLRRDPNYKSSELIRHALGKAPGEPTSDEVFFRYIAGDPAEEKRFIDALRELGKNQKRREVTHPTDL